MIQDNNKIKANAKSLQMAVSRCSMISEAEKLSKKYCIAIELDSRYTADKFSINFYKYFKNKKPEYISVKDLNNNKLVKFYKKYIFTNFLEIGENILKKPCGILD